ncbi:PREDICTED: preprotein translocase subunit SECE1 [Theobroma cacao]|uniref:Preprotein translocase subunit SECE1 n=1 Tax=Theobroma cacao TaxID=3641 RepID=A0AB32VB76_THECC|nr:PREDICTED: preprotein translocase subunit SECE1 [Theobroma cacao]
MAVLLQFPVLSSTKAAAPSPTSAQSKPARVTLRQFLFPSKTRPFLKISGDQNKNRFLPVKAVEESNESVEEPEITAKEAEAATSANEDAELSEIGAEIKKAMKEREGNTNLAGGVAEEIKEIEWPAFAKVLGTTGVVLGVIAGSSVVLLTVNAVLAELSDRVFAGKGVQDFFS